MELTRASEIIRGRYVADYYHYKGEMVQNLEADQLAAKCVDAQVRLEGIIRKIEDDNPELPEYLQIFIDTLRVVHYSYEEESNDKERVDSTNSGGINGEADERTKGIPASNHVCENAGGGDCCKGDSGCGCTGQ